MKPSRATQPYRKGKTRPAGSTLAAMLRGRPGHRMHPHAAKRMAQKTARRRRRRAMASAPNAYNRAQRVS